ncbi:hypothetical protein HPB47_023746 [Ixodes persulcatus]|uniref:Uncharacterized protein n=1 Tax=Ixodes persulcatus TaxID=34615 RepID=A0AC60Q8N9_IXOPE|nr:hypothetical protein HPB47_023746 [Ixodes persulcatus]
MRRFRSLSPFRRRRQRGASGRHRSRLRNFSRLLTSSEASGREVDNGAAVDKEFVEPLPSKKLQKAKTRLPTSRRRSCGRLHCQSDQVPEEEAQLLRSGSPNTLHHARSASFESTWSRLLKMTGAEPLLSVSTLAHPSKANASIISVGPPDMLAPKGSSQQQATEFYNNTAFVCMTALKKQRNPSMYSLEVASLAWRLEELVDTHIVMSGLPKSRIQPLKAQPEVFSFLGEFVPSSSSALYTGSHTEVMVRSPAFFDALISLVHSTEPYISFNYIGVRLMIAVAPFAPSSGRLLVQTMVEHQYGRARPLLPRWKLCIRAVERAIPDLFLHAVRLAYKTQFTMDSLQRLLDSVRQSLAGDLAKLAVLDRESRAQALSLLNVTQFRLFWPSWLTDKEKLESYVSALPRIVRGENLRSFHALHSHSFAERLRRDESDRWQGSAFDHDCSYDGKVVFVPVLLFNFSEFHHGTDQNLELPHAGVRLARCLLQLLLANISQARLPPVDASGGPTWRARS